MSSKVTDIYLRPAIGDIQKLALDSRIKAGILHTLAEFCNKQYQDKEKWDRLDLLEKQIDVKDNQVRSLKRQKLETSESITLNRYQKIIVNDTLSLVEVFICLQRLQMEEMEKMLQSSCLFGLEI